MSLKDSLARAIANEGSPELATLFARVVRGFAKPELAVCVGIEWAYGSYRHLFEPLQGIVCENGKDALAIVHATDFFNNVVRLEIRRRSSYVILFQVHLHITRVHPFLLEQYPPQLLWSTP